MREVVYFVLLDIWTEPVSKGDCRARQPDVEHRPNSDYRFKPRAGAAILRGVVGCARHGSNGPIPKPDRAQLHIRQASGNQSLSGAHRKSVGRNCVICEFSALARWCRDGHRRALGCSGLDAPDFPASLSPVHTWSRHRIQRRQTLAGERKERGLAIEFDKRPREPYYRPRLEISGKIKRSDTWLLRCGKRQEQRPEASQPTSGCCSFPESARRLADRQNRGCRCELFATREIGLSGPRLTRSTARDSGTDGSTKARGRATVRNFGSAIAATILPENRWFSF